MTEMKQDTVVTWNWFRMNVPTILAVASVGLYVNNGLLKSDERTIQLERAVERMSSIMEPLSNNSYRLDSAESSIKEAHTRIDNLSNTMINNIDLIRRDVNRQTTQIEVLASKLDIYMGIEGEAPKQRRSRPGGPISVD